ncbi:MAG: Ig-like domain-containing protein [Nanoarchaeota archaeon]|nr:Ig-like domain-containing protein [Nanoarchaeota archaeon]
MVIKSLTANEGKNFMARFFFLFVSFMLIFSIIPVSAQTADIINPIVDITNPSEGAILSGEDFVSADASDDVALTKVTFVLDGSQSVDDTTAPYSLPINTNLMSDGSHTLEAIAVDTSGNTAVDSVSFSVNNSAGSGDTTNPTVSITSPSNGSTVSNNISISATANDNVGVVGVTFVLDGNTAGAIDDTSAPYETSLQSTLISDGSHTLTATARDSAGNTNTASVAFSVNNAPANTTDTTNPTVSITSPSNGATVSGTISISANANDNVAVSSVQFKVDGNNVGSADTSSPYSASLDTTALSNGNHVLTAVAVDSSGNQATSNSISVSVNNAPQVDTVGPAVLITQPLNNSFIYGSSYNVSADASDDIGVVGVQFKVDGNNVGSEDTTVPYNTIISPSALSDGSHTLTATARDAAGNTGVYSIVFNIDNDFSQGPPPFPEQTSPVITIHAPVGTYSSYPVLFRFTINEPGNCTYVLDDQFSQRYSMVSTNASRVEFTASNSEIANGNHNVTALCRDLIGSLNFSQSDFSVNVASGGSDTTNPTVSITSPSNGATVSGTISISANANDNVAVSNVQFRVDGSNVGSADTSSPYSASLDTTTLTNGNHILTAVATDSSGNSATSSSVSITVSNGGADTTAPSVSITSPSNGATVSGTISISATASDNVAVSSVQFKVEGSNIGSPDTSSPYSASLDTTILPKGNYVLTAVATDSSGNQATSSVSVSVDNTGSGDTTNPSITITSPTNGSTVSGTVPVSATASDNIGVVGVTFFLDGNAAGAIDDTSAPYETVLQSTLIADGIHTLTATARDAAGNTRMVSVQFTVNNNGGGSDTTNPTVSITSPTNGSTVSGTISISANASDNVAVSNVQFKVDGNNVGSADVFVPYATSFTEYTSKKFSNEDNERLALFIKELKRKNVKTILSNNITKNVKILYPEDNGFNWIYVYCPRSINSIGSKRGKIPELLIKTF